MRIDQLLINRCITSLLKKNLSIFWMDSENADYGCVFVWRLLSRVRE